MRRKLENKKGKKDWKNINALTEMINRTSIKNKVTKKVDKMNGPEIIRLNRAVKKRTKTRKEFKAFVAAVRAELLMKTSEVDFYD